MAGRRLTEAPPEAPKIEADKIYPDKIRQSYDISIITPVFGGGVKPGEIDKSLPIRASAIRGMLRFWWRATRGASFTDIKSLRDRENEIWGSTDKQSPVILRVETEQVQSSHLEPCMEEVQDPRTKKVRLEFKTNLPGYALFPFRLEEKDGQKRNSKDSTHFLKPREFTLHAFLPETLLMEYEAAVWAWTNFGGYGARTRRGCGALYCEDFAPSKSRSIKDWLTTECKKYGLTFNGVGIGQPTFFKCFLFRQDTLSNPIMAWNDAIALMRNFRQEKPIARDSRGSWRSRWPEAEAVRRQIMKDHNLKKRPESWTEQDTRIQGSFFPRAEFGLPIIIHLKDEKLPKEEAKRDGESIAPVLQYSKDIDRLASPVILRPLQCKDGMTLLMLLQFHTPVLTGAYLKPGDKDLIEGIPLPATQIRNLYLHKYSDSPMKERGKNGSAVDSFVEFAIEQKFTEIKL